MGVTGLPAMAGTIRVNFAVSDFTAGSTVGYEILRNGAPQGSGSFSWTGTRQMTCPPEPAAAF